MITAFEWVTAIACSFSFYCLRLHSRIGRGPLDLAVVRLLYLDFKLVFWSSSAFCAKTP